MIYCRIKDLSKYAYSANLKSAIAYILKNNLFELPFGKTIVDGEKIFINKSNPATKEYKFQQYEIHHKYIDIQIDLEGNEKLYMVNKGKKCTHEFDETGDYALYEASEPDSVSNMDSEHCVICFPYEIHMSCVKNTSDMVVKCVFKVLDDRI